MPKIHYRHWRKLYILEPLQVLRKWVLAGLLIVLYPAIFVVFFIVAMLDKDFY